MDAAKVGKTISFLRKEAGLTQNELAKRLNITDKAVSRWERGCGTPDISLLTKLSSALNTDIKTILSSDSISIGTKCKGLLILKFPEGITASSFLYTQRIIYFQISYFILAGIRDICMFGKKEDIDFSKSQFGKGDSFGINIVYEFIDDNSDFTLYSSKYFAENNEDVSFLVINGLAFWYSKDTVNTLTRLIHDSDCCTEIVNFKRQPLSIQANLQNYDKKLPNHAFIDCHVFNAPQRVNVVVNKSEKVVLDARDGTPLEFVFSPPTDGKLTLELYLPDAVSPKTLGFSEDPRVLALALKTIVFTQGESNKF